MRGDDKQREGCSYIYFALKPCLMRCRGSCVATNRRGAVNVLNVERASSVSEVVHGRPVGGKLAAVFCDAAFRMKPVKICCVVGLFYRKNVAGGVTSPGDNTTAERQAGGRGQYRTSIARQLWTDGEKKTAAWRALLPATRGMRRLSDRPNDRKPESCRAGVQ